MDNFEIDKNNLKEELKKWFSYDINTQKELLIDDELKNKCNDFLYDEIYYLNKIYFSKDKNAIEKLNISIHFCETKEDNDLWNYLKIMTISAITSESGFGSIKMLVKDYNTNTCIGLLQLTYDLFSLETRDTYIGWNDENKKMKINNISKISYLVNISTCIGLQPMAHNMNIGKLLVGIVFSKEVLDYFYKKRGYYYTCVVTTSLYGKSVQYDRLPFIKLIGYTKGYGIKQFPIYLDKKIIEFYNKYIKDEINSHLKKLMKYKRVFNLIGYNSNNILYHGDKRGFYLGYISSKSKDFLNNKSETFGLENIKSLNEIVEWWKERWAKKRYERLHKEGKLKIMYEMKYFTNYDNKKEKLKQYFYNCYYGEDNEYYREKKKLYNQFYYEKNKKTIENQHELNQCIKKRSLNIDEIIEIILWREKQINNEKINNEKITSKNVSIYLSSLFNKNISDGTIRQYWNNKIKVYDFEFIDKKITYQKYLEILNK